MTPLVAEREGFEPPVPFSTSVFKTDAIDHSAIFPSPFLRKKRAKVQQISDIRKYFHIFLAYMPIFLYLCSAFG